MTVNRQHTKTRSIPVEVDLLILSFMGHFAWELLQAPFFSSLDGANHIAGILICLQATLGDLGIALAAFWAAALFGRSRNWAARPGVGTVAVYLVAGLLITVVLEYLNTEILNRWSYAPDMPLLPVFGTGLSPILQWLIIPSLVLWYLHRLAPAADGP